MLSGRLYWKVFVFCVTAGIAKGALPAGGAPLQSFFPVAVWWQAANLPGHSGPYPTLAAATAAAGINIMLGQGKDWPETFGHDNGEFEAIKKNGLYLIGGIDVPWKENRSRLSVASILSLAHSIGGERNLLGYNAGDEPNCQPSPGQIAMSQVPDIIAGIQGYDPKRIVTFNQTAWMIENPGWLTETCLHQSLSALQATSVASFDLYPITKPWWGPGYSTDYNTVPNDTLWMQGITVQGAVHDARVGQPIFAYIESGSDNFGFSEQNASFNGSVSDNSNILVTNGPTEFGSTWVGLALSGNGIPAGTTVASIINKTHVRMTQAAMASSSSEPVAVSGGTQADCVASVNICVVNGNEYRPTPQQVAAEVWISIINGATGIEYFCHDTVSYSFCLDDSGSGGAAATATFNNLRYIDGILAAQTAVLNAKTVASCSMDKLDFVTGGIIRLEVCASGSYRLSTSNRSVPGAILVKSRGDELFAIVQSTRRSATGATYTLTLPKAANKTAFIVYDSNSHYDRAHNSAGESIVIDAGGQFSDQIGTYDDYQVKIYRIH